MEAENTPGTANSRETPNWSSVSKLKHWNASKLKHPSYAAKLRHRNASKLKDASQSKLRGSDLHRPLIRHDPCRVDIDSTPPHPLRCLPQIGPFKFLIIATDGLSDFLSNDDGLHSSRPTILKLMILTSRYRSVNCEEKKTWRTYSLRPTRLGKR